ncbi:MAG: hypothetical protein QOG80_796 [Pseudonocardiales bacterium]|jgi:hypothetical protein|nr:hypothetical protein [Pseudonocardiales bacterium]
MTRRSGRRFRALLATLLSGASAVAVCIVAAPPAAAAATALTGTFALTPGSCSGGRVSGTYLRMILPSGGVRGPYMSNSDSRCADQSFTPLSAGTDGGLMSGSYQATPQPPFDKTGNALAGRITAPAPFYGTSFATSSNPKDPQTGLAVPAPRVYASGGALSADLRAFSVTWNNQYFNQGAPKPNGSYPGNTKAASGTYSATTGAFTLDWTSQVVGGPFDKFTGQWHLAGRFVPAGGSGGLPAPSGSTPAGGGGTAAAAATGRPVAGASSGAAASPGAPSARPSAHAGGIRATQPGSPVAGPQQLAASTTTVTHDRWRVAWWIVALSAAIAGLGFGAVVWLNRAIRASGGAR